MLLRGDYTGWQLYSDNEIVLNSRAVADVLRKHRMPPVHNSCEYEPWQNPAERLFRTLAAGAREMLQRGFGDNPDKEGYWPYGLGPYAYRQVAQVYNAMHGNDEVHGRISHLRTPFCRAYSKVPMPYRDSKLAPQAYACMHLGWSARKPGYTFEIMEGPRKGDVITSSQTKFRENVFPCHGQADAGVPREMDADLEPHDEPVVVGTEEPIQAGPVPTRRSARASVQPLEYWRNETMPRTADGSWAPILWDDIPPANNDNASDDADASSDADSDDTGNDDHTTPPTPGGHDREAMWTRTRTMCLRRGEAWCHHTSRTFGTLRKRMSARSGTRPTTRKRTHSSTKGSWKQYRCLAACARKI